METAEETKRLPAAFLFLEAWCWLTVIFVSAELVFGRFGDSNPVPAILTAGFALYLGLGIHARNDWSRLIVAGVISAGVVRTVIGALSVLALNWYELTHFAASWDLASAAVLFVAAHLLLFILFLQLLTEITAEPARKQFCLQTDSGEVRRKEKFAIGAGVAIAVLIFLGKWCFFGALPDAKAEIALVLSPGPSHIAELAAKHPNQ